MSPPAEIRPLFPGSLQRNPRLSQWLRVHRDGTVSIFSGKVEFGQGILTALAQIAAEELGIAMARIRIEPADTVNSPNEGVTSGSLSIQDSGAALRHACAEARALLLERAAERLAVPVNALQVEDGTVRASAGRSTSYWECADDSLFAREFSGSATPKSPHDYRLVGKSVARLDIPDKITGRPHFIQDRVLPGMLFGRVVRPSHGFVRLASIDDDKVKSMPGVIAVVRDGSFVGVLAEREEVAIAAMHKLRETGVWEDPLGAQLPQDIHAYLQHHVTDSRLISDKTDAPAMARATRYFEAAYTKPYISHASIGPSCAIAQWQGDTLAVWTQSQGIYNLRRDIAMTLKMSEEAVVVRHVEGAGCYGQNGADDVALDAALLARGAGGRPVLVQWMRDDEFAWSPHGPAMVMHLKAALDAEGHIVDWRHEVWSNGHSHRPGRLASPTLVAAWHLAKSFERPNAIDNPAPGAGGAASNAVPYYAFPNQRVVSHYVSDMPVRTSALRSLGAFANVFAIESFMDELASAAGCEPVEFRLRHLGAVSPTDEGRARAVIQAAIERAGWVRWMPAEGRGHGVAFARFKNCDAWCAVVAEVEVEREVRVVRLVVAADVGLAINPDGVVNQFEGGAIQATSWTLKEAVRFDTKGITSLGWEDYPILRFSEVPAVEVVLINQSNRPATGAGEAVQGPTAAAIANAVHDALGVRVRDLPLTPQRIVEAIARG